MPKNTKTKATRSTPSFGDFELNDVPFTDPDEFIKKIGALPTVKKRKYDKDKNVTRSITYYNVPAAFDIETTSFIDTDGGKAGIMYLWQFGINGKVIYGRTWDEFTTLIDKIYDTFELTEDKRLIVYVHNLPFEFQFMRKRFKWLDVFAMDLREVIYALTDSGIEFRCSYKLSGYSLEDLAGKLTTYKVNKQVGLLNYDLIRHSKTPLTDNEIKYAIYDVLVVMAYIKEKIDVDGNIARLQLTKTGYVRKYCRDCCFYGGGGKHKGKGGIYAKYHNFISKLTVTPDEYLQLRRAFQGGFTHASSLYVDKVVENVDSFDFTSSYPYVMLSEKFPVSAGRLLDKKEWSGKLAYYLTYYCCLFDVEFEGIEPKVFYDNIISKSKCFYLSGDKGTEGKHVINNGRVVSADLLRTTMTDIDLKACARFYTWKKIRFANFRIYERGYLPKNFILAILKLYQDKTELKGVDERQTDYLNSKEMLNSCYGMTVTDIIRDIISYSDDWDVPKKPDLQHEIERYNESKKRFLFYPWGVWVTAYARYNLYEGILNFGDDYIYSDTDSIKAKNASKHLDFINDYNERVRQKLQKTASFYDIPFERFEPMTIKGVKKLLGVWEHETKDHIYEKFKTLGAKRYMIQGVDVWKNERTGEKKDLSLTVSGVNKYTAIPYLMEKYKDKKKPKEDPERYHKIFKAFFAEENKGLYIPPEYTGKLTHTYIDVPRDGVITDYTGITEEYHELTSIHLEQTDYNMSRADEFEKFLKYQIIKGV